MGAPVITRVARYVASIALVAGAYYLAGRVGLELAYLDGAVAALWPPAGVGLALLVLLGPRIVPGIVIGDLLLADFDSPLGTVLGQTVGNTVAIVVAALLLRRLTNGRYGLDRVADVLAFIALRAARRRHQRRLRADVAPPRRHHHHRASSTTSSAPGRSGTPAARSSSRP